MKFITGLLTGLLIGAGVIFGIYYYGDGSENC